MQQPSVWERIEDENAYFGDLKDPFGRRLLMVITGGVAVFAKCTIEDYYVMKDDFGKMFSDLEFVLAARMDKGVPSFTREVESMFHPDTLEEIHDYLQKSIH